MTTVWRLNLVFAWCAVLMGLSGCGPVRRDAAAVQTKETPVAVDVLAATPTSLARTVTQPATVHAEFTTPIFAKVAGYLAELRVDIGTPVKAGDVLAVIDVPEMAKRRQAMLAKIRQMEADQRRADSHVKVAQASAASYEARLQRSKAEVGKAEASLAAARVELERVADLVQQQAVADRLEDEARKKFDGAAAEKTALQAAVAASEAELKLAMAQAEAADADVDVAKAMTDVARRELDELDVLINYAKLIAPFDGVVTQRHVEPGELVRSTGTGSNQGGPPLFVITKLAPVRVRVAVPERDAPLASVGDLAQVTLQALPGREFAGKISRVAGVLDEQTRTMLVEIDLPNPEGHLKPGMFGQATITLAPANDTVMLPANAVRFDEHGEGYVFLVNASDQVEIAPIETGIDNGTQIEIVAGLETDDRVIGPLLKRLKAGQTVHVN